MSQTKLIHVIFSTSLIKTTAGPLQASKNQYEQEPMGNPRFICNLMRVEDQPWDLL